MALVSDAGLPGVNDPGARLVVASIAAGVPVTVLPGASAVETALVASGLVGEQYRFVGYIPRGERERAALWRDLGSWQHPTVAFESPKRLATTLASLASAEPERLVAVCRELTKTFEEVVRATAVVLAGRYPEAPKGEVTLVIGPSTTVADAAAADAAAAVAAVIELVAAGAPRGVAANVIAGVTGVSRNTLYRNSL